MGFYVYMLRCISDKVNKTYVGYTNNLTLRLIKHNLSKGAKATRGLKWKIIYKKRIPKNDKYTDDKGSFFYSKGYAGQFYTDFPKLKDRAVMAMEGASGQSIIIDFDKGKINVINSIHTNYDWKKIAISKFN